MSSRMFPFPGRDESYEIYINDPCYSKIQKDDSEAVFDRAWNTGVNCADEFIFKHPDSVAEMATVLEGEGFSIETINKDYVIGNQRYFCEYHPKEMKITVYKESVQLWANQQDLDYDEARNIILAHEYFHYLENTTIGWISRQYMVPMLVIGKHTFGKTGVPALSEVAANAFANSIWNSYICNKRNK